MTGASSTMRWKSAVRLNEGMVHTASYPEELQCEYVSINVFMWHSHDMFYYLKYRKVVGNAECCKLVDVRRPLVEQHRLRRNVVVISGAI